LAKSPSGSSLRRNTVYRPFLKVPDRMVKVNEEAVTLGPCYDGSPTGGSVGTSWCASSPTCWRWPWARGPWRRTPTTTTCLLTYALTPAGSSVRWQRTPSDCAFALCEDPECSHPVEFECGRSVSPTNSSGNVPLPEQTHVPTCQVCSAVTRRGLSTSWLPPGARATLPSVARSIAAQEDSQLQVVLGRTFLAALAKVVSGAVQAHLRTVERAGGRDPP
jgi:hypothetical protein